MIQEYLPPQMLTLVTAKQDRQYYLPPLMLLMKAATQNARHLA
jgi:hypothetical protein